MQSYTTCGRGDNAPFVETEGRRASVASSVLCNGLVERLARACTFRVPRCLGVADELEDGVGSVGIDEEASIGGVRVGRHVKTKYRG